MQLRMKWGGLEATHPLLPLLLSGAAAGFAGAFARPAAFRQSAFIYHRLGDLSEKLVGFFFFFESVLQQFRRVLSAKQLCKGSGSAVARHFVVLHALSSGDESSIAHWPCLGEADHFFTLL